MFRGKSLYLSEPQFPHQSNWVMLPAPWGGVRVAVMVGKVPAEPCVSVAAPTPLYTAQCRKLGVPTRAPLKTQVPSGCCQFPSLRWASPEVGVGTGGGRVRGGASAAMDSQGKRRDGHLRVRRAETLKTHLSDVAGVGLGTRHQGRAFPCQLLCQHAQYTCTGTCTCTSAS